MDEPKYKRVLLKISGYRWPSGSRGVSTCRYSGRSFSSDWIRNSRFSLWIMVSLSFRSPAGGRFQN